MKRKSVDSLHVAIITTDSYKVAQILKSGVDVHHDKYVDVENPMNLAIESGKFKTVDTLFKYGIQLKILV